MAVIFDGRKLAQAKEKELRLAVKKLKVQPKLLVILVGDNQASKIYVQKKKEAGKRVGIRVEIKRFSESGGDQEILSFIQEKNADASVNGIIVQLPLPPKFNEIKIRRAIHPYKDVDCLHPKNLGMLMLDFSNRRVLPAAVKAVLAVIERAAYGAFLAQSTSYSEVQSARKGHFTALKGYLSGKNIVIVGASNLVGKPLTMVLKNLGATITLCDEYSQDLSFWTKKAEILISATGVAGLIKKEMVKKGAVVIDVGEVKGDVESSAAEAASFIAPVPGGVGPLTVVSLLENVIQTLNFQ